MRNTHRAARSWHSVTSREPCPICHKPDWCRRSLDGAIVACRRVAEGGVHRLDKNEMDYWLHYLPGGACSVRPVAVPIPMVAPVRAGAAILDHVYCALLGPLSLLPHHRHNFRTRGLLDGEIVRRGYRTLPQGGRGALARGLIKRFGADVCRQVPGLCIRTRVGRRWWSVAGAVGLVIPMRDVQGHIIALKVRSDDAGSSTVNRGAG